MARTKQIKHIRSAALDRIPQPISIKSDREAIRRHLAGKKASAIRPELAGIKRKHRYRPGTVALRVSK